MSSKDKILSFAWRVLWIPTEHLHGNQGQLIAAAGWCCRYSMGCYRTASCDSLESCVRSSSSVNQHKYISTIWWTGLTFYEVLKWFLSKIRWTYVKSYSFLSVERGDWIFPYVRIQSVLKKWSISPPHEQEALNSISFWATLTLQIKGLFWAVV